MVKIICPTDFSDTADQAIDYAAQLARKAEGELTLLNVQSLYSMTPVEAIRGKRLTIHSAEDRLQDQCSEVTKVFKIPCYAAVETARYSFADRIAKKSAAYDLIVMGTSEANDHHHFFFGSKAYQVIKESFVPVLLIPESCNYHPVSVIVFAFDYEQERKLPIIQLTQWAKDQVLP
jgi:nucleotide-binding universal stress UspA family protein